MDVITIIGLDYGTIGRALMLNEKILHYEINWSNMLSMKMLKQGSKSMKQSPKPREP